MKNTNFKRYYLMIAAVVFLASVYPLYMGIRVIWDYVQNGFVYAENYPKYIIPYTPICLAVIIGVLQLPLILRRFKKYPVLFASIVSVAVFVAAELLLENMVLVTDSAKTTLESWQMYACYIPPDSYQSRTWRAIDVLIGDCSPAFKLHFYLISLIIILSFLNVFYGFGQMILSGEYSRRKLLTVQAVSSVLYLGLCIFACFTAFYRTGELLVAPVSAFLMCAFFLIMGITVGVGAGSFLIDRKWGIVISTVSASLTTCLMYIGEMILLSGHLYRFGNGILLNEIPGLVFAPVDLMIIIISGGITALIMALISRKK